MGLKKAALISVYDKTGLVEFASGLISAGYTILSSSGSAKYLLEANLPVELIEDYTGQKEILGEGVKTLHPKVHAGILAKRNPEHLADLASIGGYEIEVVAVNLYPFIQNLGTEKSTDYQQMVELVDIGGPTMIRAAAKNFSSVYAVIDPKDYPQTLKMLGQAGDQKLEFRRSLAVKVFTEVANYNLAIARYFSEIANPQVFPQVNGMVLEQKQELRYGENPHQEAVFYVNTGSQSNAWEQLAGKELSYNNLLDFDAAVACLMAVKTDQHLAVIMKHLNPCGAAVAETQDAAISRAKLSDPRSHFGGIIAFNKILNVTTAAKIVEDFCEIVVAPDFEPDALQIFEKKKNIRLIKVNFADWPKVEWRSCANGFLLQSSDLNLSLIEEAELKTTRSVTTGETKDLNFAWQICKSVKSNAITIVKDGLLLAAGAGQMSRIDSTELAVSKAHTHGHNLKGAVAASDAFFPFPDSLELLIKEGVVAVIVPGGAKMDQEVIALAERAGISLLFTQDRHFRH